MRAIPAGSCGCPRLGRTTRFGSAPSVIAVGRSQDVVATATTPSTPRSNANRCASLCLNVTVVAPVRLRGGATGGHEDVVHVHLLVLRRAALRLVHRRLKREGRDPQRGRRAEDEVPPLSPEPPAEPEALPPVGLPRIVQLHLELDGVPHTPGRVRG